MIIDTLPSPPESFVHNCLIKMREGDETIFTTIDDNVVVARLDGYAIIPLEECATVEEYEQIRKGLDIS